MKTPWTEKLDKSCPLPEYPRPQMVRERWLSLNGEWEYAISDSKVIPERFDGTILVPFSPEAELSGVGRGPEPGQYLWYRRELTLPEDFTGKRLILHFGAVDQVADLWVNAQHLAAHVGGYLPFEAEITSALGEGPLSLVVRVTDETDRGFHTRGKQKTKRGGIWYTPQSGIWQSVWLEAVPQSYIRSLRITPFFDDAEVDVSADVVGRERAVAHFGGESYELPARIPVPGFEAWSPEHPRLYDFSVSCGEDEVKSYFAMRKFSVEKDAEGVPRLFLNNEPYFHNGLLDQGYWPDGLYTAPTDEALQRDILTAKESGFNMLRKHIKVEPLRWYYHCDRLGMLVWQDMPCGGGRYSPAVVSAPLVTGIHLRDNAYGLFGRGDEAGRMEFQNELIDMVNHLYNCPCVAMWVIFNEGWGQFDAKKMTDAVRFIDNTRTIDHASGWHDQGVGDVKSEHVYFRPYRFRADKKGRAVVLSEFGGYARAVEGHCFGEKSFGYKKTESADKLALALEELYQKQIRPAKARGLAAAVYTQLSDVEDEINGLVTYDREIVKTEPERLRAIVEIK
ncbi:MAG: glycoside hydrolase family 2 [Oscillospiraceae bacterium]|nr:glycoside hydrolase family 2 [Oscillospiraceae bacterium]